MILRLPSNTVLNLTRLTVKDKLVSLNCPSMPVGWRACLLNKFRAKKKRTANKLKNVLLNTSLKEKRHSSKRKRCTKRGWIK